MKIWALDCDVDNYENLMLSAGVNLDLLQSFNGAPVIDSWKPLPVKRMYGDRIFSNTPGLATHIPVIDKQALSTLKPLLANDAEILPLKFEDGDFFAINVTTVLDCIDYGNSEFKTLSDGKRILRFIRYSFLEDAILGHNIFKVADETLKRPFVSDEFKTAVEDSELRGFKFERVWDSEEES